MLRSKRNAFTLIELLVVIAIIAILAAILFPVFASAKLAAKKTADLSNIKQIALGFTMYATDNDDIAPPSRVVSDGSFWWTPKMLNWKDLLYPYIKTGGSRAKSIGTAFQTPGESGLYLSPLSQNAWSNAPVWWGLPGAGDETTRWPRSYAVNMSAGYNEQGTRFWPNVGDSGGGGMMTLFQDPSKTIMVSPSKLPFPDIDIYMGTTYQCTAQGQPWGNTNIGCSMTDSQGGGNYAFFDGHAKRYKIRQTIILDLWDCNTYLGATEVQNIKNWANEIAEYN